MLALKMYSLKHPNIWLYTVYLCVIILLHGLVEKELNDSDIPMKFITAQNAKWIVFSLRETAE